MKNYGLLLLSLFILFSSCKKKSDQALWNVQALAPLVQTSLTLNNIIKDTTAVVKNSDNTLSVVLREEVANVETNSLVQLKVKPYAKKVKLSSLVLNDQTVIRNITLGELARILQADANPSNVFIGSTILANQGSAFPIPSINNLTASNLPLDIKQFFDDATFISGNMEIKIENNLPLDINGLSFNVKNLVNGATITTQSFPPIPKGTSATQVVDLSGKTVEGNLLLNLTDLDLGGGFALIDTNAAIVLNITIKNVSLSAATAIFPAQNLIDDTESIILQGLGEIGLHEAWIESGIVKAVITSTLASQFDVTYTIPGATLNSVPFEISRTIPASINGNAVVVPISESFAGYKMDLKGPLNDTVNKFANRLVGSLPYTGQKVFITLDDSVDVVVTMENPIPSYVKGYLGRDTIQVGPASLSLDLFNKIESGTLNFEDATIKMIIENSLGMNGAIKINSVQSYNTKTGASQTMTGPNIGSTININKATDNPLTPYTQTIDLSTGSNAINLLNILPSQFTYDVEVISNPAGNDLSYSDFAYSTGGLKAYLDIEMPLSFYATNLTLSDTIDFNTASIKKKSVNSGTFTMHVDNGFPLDASLKLYMLDQNDETIDSLTTSSTIIAAPVNGSNVVTGKMKSMISYEITQEQMHNFYTASKLAFRVRFTTQPSATHLKLYSNYSIDFKLTGDLNYSVY